MLDETSTPASSVHTDKSKQYSPSPIDNKEHGEDIEEEPLYGPLTMLYNSHQRDITELV